MSYNTSDIADNIANQAPWFMVGICICVLSAGEHLLSTAIYAL